MKEAGFRICFPHRTCCPKLPERMVRFSARQKSQWADFKPPIVGSSLLNARAVPKIHCDSALGVKLCGPFPVHFVETECAFTTTPQYAKELTAFNPIIGHVVNRFSLQRNESVLSPRGREDRCRRRGWRCRQSNVAGFARHP